MIERRRERERITAGALEKAFACLERQAGDRLEGALEEGFLGGLAESERAQLQKLGAEERRQLEVNATEWLLAEGWTEEDGEALFFRCLLFPGSPAGSPPDLEPAERAWLEAMVAAPLRVVRADVVEPGEGMWVSEVLVAETEPRWLDEPALSLDVDEGAVFAARLLPGDPTRATGAYYELSTAALDEVKRHLEAARQMASDELENEPQGWPDADVWFTEEGLTPSELIVTTWLRMLIARGVSTSEPTTDRRTTTRAAEHLYRELYSDFADCRLPELDYQTPRQAVATEPGRRKVRQILEEQERCERERAAEQGREPADFNFVWRQLGLARGER